MSLNDFQRAGVATAPEPEVLSGEVIPSTERLDEIKNARQAAIDPFVIAAKSITIENGEDAEGATEVLAEIQRRKKSLEAERTHLVGPINEAKSRVQNLFNKLKAPLDEAREILEPKLLAFQDAEDRRIAAENAQRERELREKQRAEQARIDAERAQAAVKAKQAADDAMAASQKLSEGDDADTEAEAIAAADAARKAADELDAKRQERPAFELAEREEVKTTVQTSSGSATRRKSWVGEVADESAIPREFMKVDQTKINAAIKAGAREIAGVKIYEKSSLAVKA